MKKSSERNILCYLLVILGTISLLIGSSISYYVLRYNSEYNERHLNFNKLLEFWPEGVPNSNEQEFFGFLAVTIVLSSIAFIFLGFYFLRFETKSVIITRKHYVIGISFLIIMLLIITHYFILKVEVSESDVSLDYALEYIKRMNLKQ